MHYPVKQIKDGTCKNCSFTKDYKTVKASTRNICVMNVKYINVLTILKVFIKENLNNSFIIF